MKVIQETQIQSLGWEDPLEKEMAATPVFLPGESLTEEPGGLQSIRSQRVGHNWSDWAHTHASESKGHLLILYPIFTLQNSCLKKKKNTTTFPVCFQSPASMKQPMLKLRTFILIHQNWSLPLHCLPFCHWKIGAWRVVSEKRLWKERHYLI